VTLKLGFGVIESGTIRSADPENLTTEANITLIGKTVAKLWPFLCIQDAASRHLRFYRTANSAIRSADPEAPSGNQTWSGLDAPFARYSRLNYIVTLKLGYGVIQFKVIESGTTR